MSTLQKVNFNEDANSNRNKNAQPATARALRRSSNRRSAIRKIFAPTCEQCLGKGLNWCALEFIPRPGAAYRCSEADRLRDIDSKEMRPLNRLLIRRRGICMMHFSNSKDERLLAFYEGVRRQVNLDKQAGGRYRLAGEGVKHYADRLREEMERRRLQFTPISWD